MPYTVIHATHEAVRKIGGIGTVLEGLLTSPEYRKRIRRSILVGPLLSPDDAEWVAQEGEVLYSSVDGIGGGRSVGFWTGWRRSTTSIWSTENAGWSTGPPDGRPNRMSC